MAAYRRLRRLLGRRLFSTVSCVDLIVFFSIWSSTLVKRPRADSLTREDVRGVT